MSNTVNYVVFATDRGWLIADRDGREHGHYFEQRVAQHRANLLNGYSVARSFKEIDATNKQEIRRHLWPVI
jgi:hypothetical protein